MTRLNRPLKILHVILSSEFAGSERYCADLANLQSTQGHEVHVAGRARSPTLLALNDKVQAHALTLPLLYTWPIRQIIKRYQIDVVHGHLSHACKALAGIRHTAVRIGTLHVGYKAHQHGHLDALVCVNPLQQMQLSNFHGLSAVIPNWLPSPDPFNIPSSIFWREKLNLKPDTIVIGSVGRLNYSKGMDVLIKAYQQVAPINSVLVIAGEGPHRAKLEQLCAGDTRIHLLGHQADVRSVLSSINLFVSASREETFGLAIIEAMQQGLPVIASATEGPSQLLSSHLIPLLPPGEVEPLAQALKAWLQRHIQTKPQQINYDLRDFLPTLALQRMDSLYLDALAANQASTRSRRSDATCPLQ